MRKLVFLYTLLGAGTAGAADLAAAPPVPAGFTPEWTTTFNTEFRYFSFSGTRGQPLSLSPFGVRGSGDQFYLPIAGSVSGRPNENLRLDFTARGGYVDSRQTTPGFAGGFNGTVDSQLSATATYLGIDGVQPFASINLNLPTGQSFLAGSSFLSRLDSDLVDVPTFGEGFNVGPSLGVNVPIGATMLFTLTGGYTSRGRYDREGPTDPITGIDATIATSPGDSASVNASLAYEEGPWTGNLAVVYSRDGTTRVNGAAFVRSGERVSLSGGAGYSWSPEWVSSLNASFSHSERNFVQSAVLPGLAVEPFNSNSNLYRIGLDHLYRASNFSVGPLVSYMYRDRNSYDPTSLVFLPQRERYGAGGTFQYALSETVSLTLRAERIWVYEAVNPDKDFGFGVVPGTGTERISYTGWSVAGGATIRF